MKIAGRDVIYSATLLVPSADDAWISFTADDWLLKLNIKFVTNADTERKAGLTLEPKEDHAVLSFINWDSPFGAATVAPLEIARTASRKRVTLMAVHSFIGSTHKLDAQFSIEAEDVPTT